MTEMAGSTDREIDSPDVRKMVRIERTLRFVQVVNKSTYVNGDGSAMSETEIRDYEYDCNADKSEAVQNICELVSCVDDGAIETSLRVSFEETVAFDDGGT